MAGSNPVTLFTSRQLLQPSSMSGGRYSSLKIHQFRNARWRGCCGGLGHCCRRSGAVVHLTRAAEGIGTRLKAHCSLVHGQKWLMAWAEVSTWARWSRGELLAQQIKRNGLGLSREGVKAGLIASQSAQQLKEPCQAKRFQKINVGLLTKLGLGWIYKLVNKVLDNIVIKFSKISVYYITYCIFYFTSCKKKIIIKLI